MKNRGLRVKELRNLNKDTLKELADKIGYDYSNLSKIERGVYKGPIEVFEKIAEVYGVDVSYFSYKDSDLEEFTPTEKELIFERTLTPELLKKKYKFNIDGKDATIEEIEIMIERIRELRQQEEGS